MESNVWNDRYRSPDYVYGTEPNDWLRAQAHRFAPGGEILSLAEGEGRNAVFLAGRGLKVTAVDYSEVGLAKARALAAERGVELKTLVADLGAYDPGEARWDGVVSIWCPLPAEVRRTLHRRLVRALKPGGWLVLEAYSPEQLALGTGGPKEPNRLVSLEELKAELEGLEWLEARALRREVHEGRLHTGLSASVQVAGMRPAAGGGK